MLTIWRYSFGPVFGAKNVPLQYSNSDASHQTMAPVAMSRNDSCSIQRFSSLDLARVPPHGTALTS